MRWLMGVTSWAVRVGVLRGVIEREIGRFEGEIEEIFSPREMQRAGGGRGACALLKEIGEVFRGERAQAQGIFERPGNGLGGIDFAQRDDVAHVMAGIHAPLLELAVVRVGVGREGEEAKEELLVSGFLAVEQQLLGVIGVGGNGE